MLMRRAAPVLLLLVLGCASSHPAHAEPELRLVQLSEIPEAARNVTGPIPVQYHLTIHNTTPAPLRLRHVDLQSMGDGAYTLPATSRAFDTTIAPGATEEIDLVGTASIGTPTISGANGPVTIRIVAQFDAVNGPFQTVVVQQVHEGGSF